MYSNELLRNVGQGMFALWEINQMERKMVSVVIGVVMMIGG